MASTRRKVYEDGSSVRPKKRLGGTRSGPKGRGFRAKKNSVSKRVLRKRGLR
jgi:hypothetical protein